MCDRCRAKIKELEDKVRMAYDKNKDARLMKMAQDELVEALYEQIFCPLNDNNDIENKAKEWSNMYYHTKTTETLLTECINSNQSHNFVDVYDYQEHIPEEILGRCSRYTLNGNIECIPNILKEAKLVTKTYRLTYCKICGYTLRTE